MQNDNDLKRNASGYYDPTAYKAIVHADAEIEKNRKKNTDEERYRKLIGCILRMCELSEFSIEGRVVLKDNRTGKIWK